MKVDELFTRAKDSLEATMVYAAPVKQDGNVRWRSAVDVNRLIVVIGAVVIAALFSVGRIVRVRSDG